MSVSSYYMQKNKIIIDIRQFMDIIRNANKYTRLEQDKGFFMDKEELKRRQIENGYNHINNLVKWDNMSDDALLEIKKKGQKASVEKRKAKKNIKSICSELLNMSASDIASDVVNPEIAKKLENTDITLYDLIVAKQIEIALRDGDVKSAVFLRDSNGDKPTDKTETDINIISDSDKALLESISNRMDIIEGIQDGRILDSDVT